MRALLLIMFLIVTCFSAGCDLAKKQIAKKKKNTPAEQAAAKQAKEAKFKEDFNQASVAKKESQAKLAAADLELAKATRAKDVARKKMVKDNDRFLKIHKKKQLHDLNDEEIKALKRMKASYAAQRHAVESGERRIVSTK